MPSPNAAPQPRPPQRPQARRERPDLILRNGRIFTGDPARPEAAAPAVSGGRPIAVTGSVSLAYRHGGVLGAVLPGALRSTQRSVTCREMILVRAVAVAEYGASPALAEIPDPQPGPGQMLIKVRAAGMNPMDR